ncbi:MAG: ATP-binding cassette domain-containing protein [Spirochaetes bacterium]|nr:ATP-binding cassette domain-containing protein [Spirochaetota bacterium]
MVRNITFEFESSKTTALVGPSGGGKSTVLKLAAGIIVPEEGGAFYKGKDIAEMTRAENLAFRREGAFVFQDSALWANQNLFQILELPLRIHFPDMDAQKRQARIKSVTAEVGYRKSLDVRPAELSMGEQKLIAFARALLCDPALLYLDEWTESLDTSAADHLIELVKERQAGGATVLFVSHDMQIVQDLADTIVVIAEGQLSMTVSKEQLAKDEGLMRYMKTWAAP